MTSVVDENIRDKLMIAKDLNVAKKRHPRENKKDANWYLLLWTIEKEAEKKRHEKTIIPEKTIQILQKHEKKKLQIL